MAETNAHNSHYGSDGIADRILAAYRAVAGAGAPLTPEALAPLDHFHGGGLDSTKGIAKLLDPQAGEHILDIGSGIGGPARWFATTFGCRITGVDLTPEFCAAARALNQAIGLDKQITILDGNALALPFPDNTFDRAYSQNVVMNIPDKVAYYREALRVVKPGGVVCVSVVGRGPNGEPEYPMPWATTAAESFLSTPDETRAELLAAGAEIVHFEETTERDRAGQQATIARLESKGMPRLGLQVLMGERMATLQLNSTRARAEGRLSNVEALIRKPG